VLADNPLNPAMCDVTIDVFNELLLPYEVDVPYSTCVSLASLVAHDTDAPLEVIPELATELIVGGVVSDGVCVVKEKSPDVARLPAESLDLTL